MTIHALTHRSRNLGALALIALVACGGLLLARGSAEAQQSPWPTRPGERWVLAGPYAVDLAKGRHTINLATINGSVRGVRIGARDKGLVITGITVRYADPKSAEITRRIVLKPRERTRMLAGTTDEHFLDGSDLGVAPGSAPSTGPVLVELWLLQTAAGAVAQRPAPQPKAVAAAPKPAAPAPVAQPTPPPVAPPKPPPHVPTISSRRPPPAFRRAPHP